MSGWGDGTGLRSWWLRGGRGLNGVIGLAYTVELWWDMGIDEINDRGVVMGENDLQTELSDGGTSGDADSARAVIVGGRIVSFLLVSNY